MNGIEELNILPNRLYKSRDVRKLINQIKKVSYFTVLYYYKKGQVSGAFKGTKRNGGAVCWLIKGSDLENFIVDHYF